MASIPFVMRTTEPSTNNKWYICNSRNGGNGWNSCVPGTLFTENGGKRTYHDKQRPTRYFVLPNCTGYVHGRWMESQSNSAMGIMVTNDWDTLPAGDATCYYEHTSGTYKNRSASHSDGNARGSTPKLGAIACWKNGGKGHVAFVEAVYSNTDVLLSMSNAYSAPYFETKRGNPKTMYSGMKFQGYIYPPVTWSNSGNPSPDPAEDPSSPSVPSTTPVFKLPNSDFVRYPDKYLGEDDKKNNAVLTYMELQGERGWSANAVYALLGNMEQESTINPGLWEGRKKNVRKGFGLVQWTPSTNYTRWADAKGYSHDEGYGQLEWIDEQTTVKGQWIQTSAYPISFNDWKHDTTHSVEWLTKAFERNFERSADNASLIKKRVNYALKWQNWFNTTVIVSEADATLLSPEPTVPGDELVQPEYTPSQSDDPPNQFNYHKQNNKHMLIARRPFVY